MLNLFQVLTERKLKIDIINMLNPDIYRDDTQWND